MNNQKNVIITGGGAAGMAASVFLAQSGCKVRLIEKNEKLGKKVYITGKGRCNFTNACEEDEFLSHVVTNPRFLYSAFAGFTNHDAIRFFETLGLRTKIERGSRAFPASDHASDVIRVLENRMRALGVEISLNTEVIGLISETEETDGQERTVISGVKLADGSRIYAETVIVATGGLSYPSTGSTGDGYRFAEALQLPVSTCRPALVPLLTEEAYIPKMQGLSLKNVRLTIPYGKKGKKRFSEFGEMLFTHEGISGPLALSASSYIGADLADPGKTLRAEIDLKPALTEEQLDARLLREFDAAKNKSLKNVIGTLLPSKMRPVLIELSGISPEKAVHDITKPERQNLVRLIKAFPFTLCASGSYREAVITQGGISTKAVHPKTMEAKKVSGLYFIGEVLDVDAVTGGFNLQIAWSTAHAAAEAIAAKSDMQGNE